jgi:UPF0755 protein
MKRTNVFVFAGILFVACSYFLVQLLVPLPTGNTTIEVEIPAGTTFRQALEIFSRKGLLRDKNILLLLGKISGIDRRIRAGYYSVNGSVRPLDIFNMLKEGRITEYDMTIVEGDSLLEIGDKLSQKDIISQDDFMRLASDEKFLDVYDIEAPSIEGYLFPDTYKVPKGIDPEDAIGMMIRRMREKFTPDLYERASEIGLSEREVLTLASIIEKESVTDEERFLISAVFHNRLSKGIPLQADPTAIYGIKSSKEKITASDLRKKTKYNTYVIKGLPPGPIASPSIKSIEAALYPADVPYVYFVSNNDGTHHFSVTAAEHTVAVKAYREKKLKDEKENQQKAQKNEKS